MLRDLRFVTERDETGSCSELPVVPALLTPAGVAHAGALATLVDMAGGEAALRAVRPSWVATSDLVLHVTRPVEGGVVRAHPSLLRRSRATAVIEVDLSVGEQPVGFSTVSFAVLEPRAEMDTQRVGTGASEARTEFGGPDQGLSAPLAETLSVTYPDARAGVAELPITPYVGNSLGALQGGVVVMLVELAALALGRERLGREVVALDLAVNYLRLVRCGPARTRARVLRENDGSACPEGEAASGQRGDEQLVRVEVLDAGDEGRVCTVATVLVRAAA